MRKKQEEEFEKLDSSTAFTRIAGNLDLASMHANKKKDVQGLITVAVAWMQFSDFIANGEMPKKKFTIGFGPEEEEQDERPINRRKGRSSIHKKSREL
jgi:hypothetical protein